MISIVERGAIPAPPERVWSWFAEIEEHYLAWHPAHVAARVLDGTPVVTGSTIFFDERLGSFRLALRYRIVAAYPQRLIRYKGLFPYSLLRVGGWFALEPSVLGCDFIAEVHVGWPIPVLGPLLDRLIAAVLPLPELRRHVTEEGRNLARLLG